MPTPNEIRVVIDVNVFVSYFMGSLVRERLDRVLVNRNVTLLFSDALWSELDEVLARPKFKKYFTPEQAKRLVQTLLMRSQKINVQSQVAISRDMDDDYLLALCLDSAADFLITGDRDLLTLDPFGPVRIVPLAVFCEISGV